VVSGEAREETEAEVAAIFARLKEEVRSLPADEISTRTSAGRKLAGRSEAERAWAVTAERPFEHPPTRGRRVRSFVIVPVKLVLRKLMRWYVEPVAAQQRSFNLAVLRLVDQLADRTDADVRRLERRLEALEERVARERVEPGG
jgi:hypothetical protein